MNRRTSTLVALLSACALAGCATTPLSAVPDGYDGPVAQVADTARQDTAMQSVFYMVAAVDGSPVRTSLERTRQAHNPIPSVMVLGPMVMITPAPALHGSQGMFSLAPTSTTHRIFAGRPVKLSVQIRTADSSFAVVSAKGPTLDATIEVDAKPGAMYRLRGTSEPPEIWLEDMFSGERVGRVVPGS